MTLLVALNLGELAIIAADKKEVLIKDGNIYPLNESAEKIIDTGIGLITGSGYVTLLDRVKEKVSSNPISNTDQILSIIIGEREEIQGSFLLSDAQKSELLDKTGWLFSYRTMVADLAKLRVALFHPSISSTNLSIIEENTSKILFPSDMDEKLVSSYVERLNNEIKLTSEGDIQEAISHNVSLVLNLIHSISQVSQTVSESCDIGLALENGENYIATSVSKDTRELSFVPIHS